LVVGGGGSVVEDPLGCALTLVEAPPEDVVLLPERQHPQLARGQVHLRVDRPVPRHPFAPARSSLGQKKSPRPVQGRGVCPAVPPCLARRPGRRPLAGRAGPRRPSRPSAVTGGTRPRLLRASPLGTARFGRRLGEDVLRGPATGP